MGHNESSTKRKTYSSQCLQKETGESICLQLDRTPKSSRKKKEANIPRRSRRQEIIKLKAEINQVEMKRTIQRINKTRNWFFEKINKVDKPLARLTRRNRVYPNLKKKSEMKRET